MSTPGPDPEISLDQVLSLFEAQADTSTPLTATEVADELDCARRTAYKKLRQLEERDDLSSKTVGASARVWWLPSDDD